jgi:predicted nucleic-acid-binding protein
LLGLRSLLRPSNFQIEDENAVLQALTWYQQGMDFADALHLASVSGETEFATFDASLRRTAGRLGIGRVVAI